MKKVNIQVRFAIDSDKDDRNIDKFDSYLEIVDNSKVTKIQSDFGDRVEVLQILKLILNRWDDSSRKISLTQVQFNRLKQFIQELDNEKKL